MTSFGNQQICASYFPSVCECTSTPGLHIKTQRSQISLFKIDSSVSPLDDATFPLLPFLLVLLMHHCMNMMDTNFLHLANFDHIPTLLPGLSSTKHHQTISVPFLPGISLFHEMGWRLWITVLSWRRFMCLSVCLWMLVSCSCSTLYLYKVYFKYTLITLLTYSPSNSSWASC